MRYATLCSGIEAPTVAWTRPGKWYDKPAAFSAPWTPVFYSEIEPFPCAVLKHHYPNVPNLGNMLDYDKWLPELTDGLDVLFAGCPCQDFSHIGTRSGVSGTRGNLTLTFIEAVRKWKPKWTIFENVPGILSSKDNAFGQLLAGLCGEDQALPMPGTRWPDAGLVSGPDRVVAWRILDAQYFGLPQNRRRVYLLAGEGPGDFRCAAALFPLSSGMPGRPTPRHKSWSDYRSALRGSPGKGGGHTVTAPPGPPLRELVPSTGELSHCLNAGSMGRIDLETETMVAEYLNGEPVKVRALTPLECERIQGFPDHYTLIPGWKGNKKNGEVREDYSACLAYFDHHFSRRWEAYDHMDKEEQEAMLDEATRHPDGCRYKAIGNAIGIPVLGWLKQRILEVSMS